MMRDRWAGRDYWDNWISSSVKEIEKKARLECSPEADRNYRPQYVYDIANEYRELIISKYSRGDARDDMSRHFEDILDFWEKAEALGKGVWSDKIQYTRHAWQVNIDHYVICFWLVGIALAVDIHAGQWERLLKLIGNEGQDILLDKVIASRQKDRMIGRDLCFPKAYGGLLAVVKAPRHERPMLLRKYLDEWFAGLKDAGSLSFPKAHRTPYWWSQCADKARSIKGGFYTGCWCIEAVAVAKAFDIDDSLCLDHPNYPGDLITDGRSPRYLDGVLSKQDNLADNASGKGLKKLFARLFGRG